ncbi:MAG: SufD family Fe-S cluster assembly protein [Nanoarchaeota archaeon]
MTTNSVLQHSQDHNTSWFEEKRKNALASAETGAEPLRGKQEIGMLSLEGFSVAALLKNSAQHSTQILHIPQSLVCLPLEEALTNPHYAALIQSTFGTIIPIDNNKFHALHYGYAHDILFVYVPRGLETQEPLHIKRFLSTTTSISHILIIAEPLSKLIVMDEQESTHTNRGYVSTFVEAVVKEGADVQFVGIHNHGTGIDHNCIKKADVRKDGKIAWVEAYFGSNYTRSIVTATLHDDGGSSTNTTVFFAEGTSKYDIMARTIQVGKHTYADMNTIGVVADKAKSMCRGLIKIAPSSFGSSGHQKIKTLLMNRDAQANAIPSMEIDNFDVRATHESSVGQISKDKLFYLMSRGLDEHHARMKIVEGYFNQLTKLIPDKNVEQKIGSLIKQKLHAEEGEEEVFLEEQEEGVSYA